MGAEKHVRIYDAALVRMAADRSLALKPEYLEDAIAVEGTTRRDLKEEAIVLLKNSPDALSADEIEAIFALSGDLAESSEGVDILNLLISQSNHHKHEDIVRSLQKAHDPSSISALVGAIQADFDYLSWDEDKALARKCMWALAAIGTKEAWSEIGRFSQLGDPVVAAWAKEQLDRRGR
jgi:hypothetical protein